VNKQIVNRQNTSGVKQSIECVFRGWNKRLYFNPGHSDPIAEPPKEKKDKAEPTVSTASTVKS
jgi:hypothetical protein